MQPHLDITRLLAGIGGQYTLVRPLGAGSRAEAYHVRDRSGRDLVMKVVHPSLLLDESYRNRALREMEVTSRLRHPNILPILDNGQFENELYYVVPHVRGGSLSDLLMRRGQLSPDEVLRIGGEIADGLQYAHRHAIVHAHISPDDVLFDGDRPLIREFGFARVLGKDVSGDRLTSAGVVVGSPMFISPEQLTGMAPSTRSDVYGLALLVVLMVSGDLPMQGKNVIDTIMARMRGIKPEELPAKVPVELRDALVRALDPDPAKRPASVGELVAILSEHFGVPASGPGSSDSGQDAESRVVIGSPPASRSAPVVPPADVQRSEPAPGRRAPRPNAESEPPSRIIYAGTLFGRPVPIAVYPLVTGIVLAIYVPVYLWDSPKVAISVGALAAMLLIISGMVLGFGVLTPTRAQQVRLVVDAINADTVEPSLKVVPHRPHRARQAASPAEGLRFHYDILRPIGEGGMAQVFLAKDLRYRDRQVAIKVMRPEFASSDFVVRFHDEINIIASFTHPSILPLLDSGDVDGRPFFVMPYIEGSTLRARLASGGGLAVPSASRIAAATARALHYAHGRTVVHRDVKPENILLQGDAPLLADFGIALMTERDPKDRKTQGSLGTPHYMSPEQWEAPADIGPASDQYSLGCVLFEMLTGDTPYLGTLSQLAAKHCSAPIPAVRDLAAHVPERLEVIVTRMLQKNRNDRFASLEDVAQLLEA